MDSRPWDYQAEECSLRSAVDRFNHRRYQRELPNIQQQSQMQQSQEKSTTVENQVFGQEVGVEICSKDKFMYLKVGFLNYQV